MKCHELTFFTSRCLRQCLESTVVPAYEAHKLIILLVEDDPKIAKFIRQGLKEEGYTVRHFVNGENAFQAAKEEPWDVLVLDVMLPGKNGLDVCRDLRAIGQDRPILMLTAKDGVEDRVRGLDAGADDYLVKPFAFSELLARIRALERRLGERKAQTTIDLGGLCLDLIRHRVSYKEKEIDLTSREFALLQFFLRRAGHVLSRTVILESVWGYDFQSGTNVVDVYVNYLRQKLKAATGKTYIRTLRNRGYVFETEP
jgi:DNA-binding response OmpR family regulator